MKDNNCIEQNCPLSRFLLCKNTRHPLRGGQSDHAGVSQIQRYYMFIKRSFLKWIFSKAVKKTLLAEFENENIVRLLNTLWNLHEEIPESPTKDESRSVGLLLSSARKSIALYRAFLEMGISDETAKKYIEKVNWELGKYLGAPIYSLSRISGKNPVRRINWINDALWRFLFTEPFKRAPVESDADVAFNITRCPFQEYYKSQNLLELCEFASCSQDHLLAKAWHSKFQRKQTLASGGDYCDFRFYTDDRG